MSATNPSTDDLTGLAWWHRLTERERSLWQLRVGSDAPADAWALFRASLSDYPISGSPGAVPPESEEDYFRRQY